MKKLAAKLVLAAKWAVSPEGRKDIALLIAAATAVYTALHRFGV